MSPFSSIISIGWRISMGNLGGRKVFLNVFNGLWGVAHFGPSDGPAKSNEWSKMVHISCCISSGTCFISDHGQIAKEVPVLRQSRSFTIKHYRAAAVEGQDQSTPRMRQRRDRHQLVQRTARPVCIRHPQIDSLISRSMLSPPNNTAQRVVPVQPDKDRIRKCCVVLRTSLPFVPIAILPMPHK